MFISTYLSAYRICTAAVIAPHSLPLIRSNHEEADYGTLGRFEAVVTDLDM